MERLIELDRDLFIALNSFHAQQLDQVIFVLTNTYAWIPLYVLLFFFIFKSYGSSTWIYLIGIAITIVLADQVTSSLMKPMFERLRPTHDPVIKDLVHTVNNYKGGKFGFASSHAANTFGCALFIHLMLHNFYRWSFLLFFWAAFVCYTRIYLGVHYPGDLVVGALIGMLFGFLSFLSCKKISERYHLRRDKSF